MPTACTVSTIVSLGAAIAAGRGLSSAMAVTDVVSKSARTMLPNDRILLSSSLRAKRSNPRIRLWRDGLLRRFARNDGASRRHRLAEVVRDLVEEAGGRQPALVGADQEREVLGHVPVLDGGDAALLQRVGEFCQLRVVVALGAVREPARPGEDRGDRVGRGLLALLVLAVMPGHRAVRGLGLHGLAVGGQQHRGHQAERAVTLRHGVGLYVAVIVLAGPDIAAGPLQRRGDHVVDQPVLVGEALGFEFLLELAVVYVLEDVL